MRCCCGLPHAMTGRSRSLWSAAAAQTGHHGCDRGGGCLMGQLTHSMGHLGHLMFNPWRVFCISINQDNQDGHPRKMAGRSLGKTGHRLLNCSTAPFWWRPWAWPAWLAWRLRNSSVARPVGSATLDDDRVVCCTAEDCEETAAPTSLGR